MVNETDVLYHVGGEIIPADEATISVTDRGFLYGDAAFETLRAYNGSIFQWEAHVERLDRTCNLIGLNHGYEPSELRARVREVLAANEFTEAYVRLSITRGEQPGKLTPKDTVDPTVVIIVSELPMSGMHGSTVWDEPAVAEIVDVERVADGAVPAAAKTHNYLNGILARNAAGRAVDEAIMLDSDNNLTEGTTSNLFFVDDGIVKTPALSGPILPGITREVILEIVNDLGLPVEVTTYEPSSLHEASEAFFTNSTWEVRSIERVGDTVFNNQNLYQEIRQEFSKRIEREFYSND